MKKPRAAATEPDLFEAASSDVEAIVAGVTWQSFRSARRPGSGERLHCPLLRAACRRGNVLYPGWPGSRRR